MKTRIRRMLRMGEFRPGLVGFCTNPFYFARAALWRAMVGCASHVTGQTLLDVGCGSQPYRGLFKVDRYIGLEYDTPSNRATKHAELWYDGSRFPLHDGSVDVVLCNQVLEHVFTPDAFLSEIARVLRPGGQVLLTVPFVWDEHEQPYDFGRYTRFGIVAVLERAGFMIELHEQTVSDARLLVQLLAANLDKRCPAWPGILRWPARMAWCLPAHSLGTILGWCIPWAGDLYLDHVILARKGRGA